MTAPTITTTTPTMITPTEQPDDVLVHFYYPQGQPLTVIMPRLTASWVIQTFVSCKTAEWWRRAWWWLTRRRPAFIMHGRGQVPYGGCVDVLAAVAVVSGELPPPPPVDPNRFGELWQRQVEAMETHNKRFKELRNEGEEWRGEDEENSP